MINLAEYKDTKRPYINSCAIESNINDFSIYKYYCPKIIYGKLIESPLRQGDGNPSFGLYYSKITNKMLFNDFGYTGGDAIRFVSLLLKISPKMAMERIAYDFGIHHYFEMPDLEFRYSDVNIRDLPKLSPEKLKTITVINIKSRLLNKNDIRFWDQFGICVDTLNKFNIIPISHYFVNDYVIKADRLAYAFREEKDGKVSYKIYQPISKDKWMTNHDKTVHQGYTQLPESGNILIITKSLKDVCTLHDVFGWPAVGIQSESIIISNKVIAEYKSRFKEVYTHFDFDHAGLVCSSKYFNKHNLIPLFTFNSKCKDISDLVKDIGKDKAYNFFKNIHGCN